MNELDEHSGYSECPSCHETADLNLHHCFVKVPTDPEELEDRARIVQVNKQTRLRHEACNDPNTVTEGGEEEDIIYHPPLLVFWDTEAMQEIRVCMCLIFFFFFFFQYTTFINKSYYTYNTNSAMTTVLSKTY